MSFPGLEFDGAVDGYQKKKPMLVAYFDESGTHDQSKVVCIAGLVGTAIEWSRIERPWEENLRTTRVPWFHANDCEEGIKLFDGFEPRPAMAIIASHNQETMHYYNCQGIWKLANELQRLGV